jgi:Zn-dependent M28 family amino/carboxypeptidase
MPRLFSRMALITAVLTPAASCLPAQSTSASRGAATISEASLRKHLSVIAADSMMGRNTPSRGLEMTALYIAQHFRAAGLEPGGDKGTFLQRYTLSQGRTQATGSTGRSKIVEPPATAPNVVGIIDGTDAVLKNEYVVFSAHMDHVGVNSSSASDSIWNGADDDASGTVAVMELAKAFSVDRPRRSLIFLTVSGEEKGLLGSRWFTEHTPVPIKQIVADVNMDMIGRNWRDTIVAIGREHSDLGATLQRVNAAHPELQMTAIGDLWPMENFYFRSDHFNFARRGVPILFFFNGVHADYHRPSDSAEKIDYEKESRIVRLIFFLGQDVANRTDRPKWNEESYQRIVNGSGGPKKK